MGATTTKRKRAESAGGEFENGEYVWRWNACEDVEDQTWSFEIWRMPGSDFELNPDLPDAAFDERGWRGIRATKDEVKVAMVAVVLENS